MSSHKDIVFNKLIGQSNVLFNGIYCHQNIIKPHFANLYSVEVANALPCVDAIYRFNSHIFPFTFSPSTLQTFFYSLVDYLYANFDTRGTKFHKLSSHYVDALKFWFNGERLEPTELMLVEASGFIMEGKSEAISHPSYLQLLRNEFGLDENVTRVFIRESDFIWRAPSIRPFLNEGCMLESDHHVLIKFYWMLHFMVDVYVQLINVDASKTSIQLVTDRASIDHDIFDAIYGNDDAMNKLTSLYGIRKLLEIKFSGRFTHAIIEFKKLVPWPLVNKEGREFEFKFYTSFKHLSTCQNRFYATRNGLFFNRPLSNWSIPFLHNYDDYYWQYYLRNNKQLKMLESKDMCSFQSQTSPHADAEYIYSMHVSANYLLLDSTLPVIFQQMNKFFLPSVIDGSLARFNGNLHVFAYDGFIFQGKTTMVKQMETTLWKNYDKVFYIYENDALWRANSNHMLRFEQPVLIFTMLVEFVKIWEQLICGLDKNVLVVMDRGIIGHMAFQDSTTPLILFNKVLSCYFSSVHYFTKVVRTPMINYTFTCTQDRSFERDYYANRDMEFEEKFFWSRFDNYRSIILDNKNDVN